MRRAVSSLCIALTLALCAYVLHGQLGTAHGDPAEPASETDEPSAHSRRRSHESGHVSTRAQGQVAERAQPTRALHLEGQVVDPDELPVSGARVSLLTNPPRSVETGPDGCFEFRNLKAGDYRLAARAEALMAGPLTLSLRLDTQPLLLRLSRGSSLVVRVLNQLNDAPIGDAVVEVDALIPIRASTDQAGRASVAGLTPSMQPVRVSARGFESKSVLIAVPAASETPSVQDVRLRAGTSVCGRVLTATGQAAPNTEMRLERSGQTDDPSSDVLVTEEHGRFCFDGVARGSVRISARHAELGTARSAQLALDGVRAPPAVELVLASGARLSGRVLDVDGSPLALAEVRVAFAEAGAGFAGARATRTRTDGAFSLAGLEQGRVRVIALLGASTSDTAIVELADGESKVELRLRGDQVLRGVVVTRAGEPVEGAQVAATEETSRRTDRGEGGASDLSVRGLARAVTDADGSFTLTRLRRGSYRVRASRSESSESAAFWLSRGVVATAGDHGVKVVLQGETKLRGRVVFEDGEIPQAFTVALPLSAPVPFRGENGVFQLDSVPSGVQSLTIAGMGITPKFLDEVRVRESGETDVGTVRLQRARRLTGLVSDEKGVPVANASVHVSGMLLGDASDAVSERLMPGALRALSDQAGRFVIETLPRSPLVAIAQHDLKGRSSAFSIPAEQAAPDIKLTVSATAGLSGHVTRKGKPAARSYVVASMPDSQRARWIVQTEQDGAYRFDALAPGRYVVSAATAPDAAGASTSESVAVELQAGAMEQRDLTLTPGDLTVDVHMVARASGATVPHAQAYLLSGQVSAAKAGELELAIAARGAGTTQIVAATQGDAAHFESVSPGSYSFCAIPIYDDITDPVVAHKLNRDAALLPASCVPLAIAQAPDLQQVTVSLP